MLRIVRKVRIAVLIVLGVVGAAALAVYIYASAEYTACYGLFESRGAAERAAREGRDGGLYSEVDHRSTQSAVTFESGETGEDARRARRTFRAVVRRHRGSLGHPDGGCLERQRFE